MSELLHAILTGLNEVGLWGFPIAFKPSAGGGYDKKPLVAWKPYQQRPPSEEEMADWCKRFPDASAGMPTGPRPGTGLVVVDSDNVDTIEYVEKRGMPETWLARTRKGFHYYCRHPADFEVRNSASQLATRLDIRGVGGFVATPGSQYRLASGEMFIYQWEKGCSPRDLPLADMPKWLSDALREKAEREKTAAAPAPVAEYRGRMSAWARKALEANLQQVMAAAPGARNKALFDVARRFGQLAAGGELETAAVLEPLYAVAEAWDNTKHSQSTIARAFALGQTKPRSARH